ncbi:MAG: hypothetical protein J7M21_03365, partial [Planctomycetes bacterium]|nr:hypothetical protein [Planctomycetota bacterium]
MAKRKKLNRRVAVLLGAIGAVLVALGVTVVLRGFGGGSLIDRLFPKDPVAMIERARAAVKAGDLQGANQAYNDAITAARNRGNDRLVQQYYYEYAKFNHDWALSGKGLTKTQRQERVHA